MYIQKGYEVEASMDGQPEVLLPTCLTGKQYTIPTANFKRFKDVDERPLAKRYQLLQWSESRTARARNRQNNEQGVCSPHDN